MSKIDPRPGEEWKTSDNASLWYVGANPKSTYEYDKEVWVDHDGFMCRRSIQGHHERRAIYNVAYRVTPREEDKPVETIDLKAIKIHDRVEALLENCPVSGDVTEVFWGHEDDVVPIKVMLDSGEDYWFGTSKQYRITKHIPSPTPSPAEGTAEWAEEQAKKGHKVRRENWDDGTWISFKDGEFVQDSLYPVRDLESCATQIFKSDSTGWELVPEDPAPAPADAGGEHPIVGLTVGQWYGSPSSDDVYFYVGKDSEQRPVFDYTNLETSGIVIDPECFMELVHLPGFDPAKNIVLRGFVYTKGGQVMCEARD